MHLDGARIFNASVASQVDVKDYAQYFDSVSFCLSKALGCPAGSMVVGSKDLIGRVKRFRKMFGGGMRQIGILAAAGLYAFDHHIDRLVTDHQHAQRLARALTQLPGVAIDPDHVETNLVFCDIAGTGKSQQQIIAELKHHGVLVGPNQKTKLRLVTHLDISEQDIGRAIDVLNKVLS
jgi:threonine aldolase